MEVGTIVAWIQLAVWLSAAAVGIGKIIKRSREKDRLEELNLSQKGIYALLVLGLLVSSASLYFNYRPRIVEKTVVQTVQEPPRQIFKAWGSTDPTKCFSVLDTVRLMNYADKYDVAVICGLTDPTVDKFEDQRITVSSTYTIRPGDLEIAAPLSMAMTNAVQHLRDEAVKSLPTKPKRGTVITLQIPMWYETVLILKGTLAADIRKLSDVPRYGGKILSQGS